MVRIFWVRGKTRDGKPRSLPGFYTRTTWFRYSNILYPKKTVYRWGSCKKIVFPECFYRGSSFSGIYKLDSGRKPAGMTEFWTFARGSGLMYVTRKELLPNRKQRQSFRIGSVTGQTTPKAQLFHSLLQTDRQIEQIWFHAPESGTLHPDKQQFQTTDIGCAYTFTINMDVFITTWNYRL